MQFTDSHCHLDFPQFAGQLKRLISRCHARGIHRVVVPAVDAQNWHNVLDLCDRFQGLYPALGVHPWWVDKSEDSELHQLTELAGKCRNKLIAIGEIGIDGALQNHVTNQQENLIKQHTFFEYQLQLANKLDLPVLVHHRKSHQLIQPILKKIQLNRGGIIHGFSGSYQQAKGYLDLGFKLGIGGTITYPRAKKTRNAIKRLPLEAMVLETDAPSMPLNGFQGEPNSPLKVIEVFNCLVELIGSTPEKLANQMEHNVNQVFSWG